MEKIIFVYDFYGSEEQTIALKLDVVYGVNIHRAAAAACTEYCKTEEGKKKFEGNCNNFNWGDLSTYVPNEICKKYGFEILDQYEVETYDLNEALVDEMDIFPEEEEDEERI